MKSMVLVWLLAACSYKPPTANLEDDAMPASEDAALLPDTAPSSLAPCSAPDPAGLVLCLELEDGVADGTLLDSAPGHHDATAQHLTPAMRTLGPIPGPSPAMSPAAEVHPDAVVRIPEDPAFDRDAAYTLAMWVHPNTLPALGEVYGLFDHEQQLAMLIGRSVEGNLQNRCVHTGVTRFEFTEQLPANAWSFLACTWDGVELCASRWSADRDTERYCHRPTILPNATGAEGLSIGHLSERGVAHSRFDGAIDSVQLYDRSLSEDQLCAIVGKNPGCMPCIAGCN